MEGKEKRGEEKKIRIGKKDNSKPLRASMRVEENSECSMESNTQPALSKSNLSPSTRPPPTWLHLSVSAIKACDECEASDSPK